MHRAGREASSMESILPSSSIKGMWRGHPSDLTVYDASALRLLRSGDNSRALVSSQWTVCSLRMRAVAWCCLSQWADETTSHGRDPKSWNGCERALASEIWFRVDDRPSGISCALPFQRGCRPASVSRLLRSDTEGTRARSVEPSNFRAASAWLPHGQPKAAKGPKNDDAGPTAPSRTAGSKRARSCTTWSGTLAASKARSNCRESDMFALFSAHSRRGRGWSEGRPKRVSAMSPESCEASEEAGLPSQTRGLYPLLVGRPLKISRIALT